MFEQWLIVWESIGMCYAARCAVERALMAPVLSLSVMGTIAF